MRMEAWARHVDRGNALFETKSRDRENLWIFSFAAENVNPAGDWPLANDRKLPNGTRENAARRPKQSLVSRPSRPSSSEEKLFILERSSRRSKWILICPGHLARIQEFRSKFCVPSPLSSAHCSTTMENRWNSVRRWYTNAVVNNKEFNYSAETGCPTATQTPGETNGAGNVIKFLIRDRRENKAICLFDSVLSWIIQS